jgi:hypothetical protein
MTGWELLRAVNLSLAAALAIVIVARTVTAPTGVRAGLAVVLGWVVVDAATHWGPDVEGGGSILARTGLLLASGWWLWADYRLQMAEARTLAALTALVNPDDDPDGP